MNKIQIVTKGNYRCVYVNKDLSKVFHVICNDNAYTDANKYAYEALTLKEYPIIPKARQIYLGISNT